MDLPLSALSLSSSPGLRAARFALPQANGGIPAAELQTLSPAKVAENQPAAPAAPSSFEAVLGQTIAEVNGRQTAANEAVVGLVSGQNVSLHQAMIAMEEASVSFQLMVEVRNRLLDSYQELMRMQI